MLSTSRKDRPSIIVGCRSATKSRPITRFFWRVFIVAVAILGLFIYWNRRLAREIVARQQTEISLKAMQAEFNKQERLSMLGQLTATVSHELRNPLGTIKTSSELLKLKLEELGVNKLPALERLDRSVSRCDGIINELLDYTRIRPEHFEEIVLDKYLAEILAELTIPEGIELQQNLTSQAVVRIDKGADTAGGDKCGG